MTAQVPAEAVGPLIRGMAVLRELALSDGRRPVSALVPATGLARSTVDRVVGTLERLGYLRAESREVCLTPRLMELGNAYLSGCRLPDLLGPLADALADTLDESVSIAVPDRDGVRFVHQATRRRAMSLTFRIGDLLPAERGATGALFATDWTDAQWDRWRARRAADPAGAGFPALPDHAPDSDDDFVARVAAARQAGRSVDDQLIEPGLVAVAMPVRDPSGARICAVSVVSHTSRHTARDLGPAVHAELTRTVGEMERVLAAAGADAGARADAGAGAGAGAGAAGAPAAGAPAAGAPAAGEGGDGGGGLGRGAQGGGSPALDARAAKQELGPEFVESLARGLAVLRALGGDGAGRTLSAVAAATGLARATARRSLITLEHLGYVTAEAGRFRLTPRVLELGFACLSGLTMAQIAQPHLVRLVQRVRDSASMAVPAGDDIRYVARVPTVRIMSVNITVGTRFPAYATGMGRVLLAGLPAAERAARLARVDLAPLTRHTITSADRLLKVLEEVAADGYALVDQELEEGLRSIAVPVRDVRGRVVAAVNVSTHASRSTVRQTREELLPPLRAAAEDIMADLRIAGRFGAVTTG
jgi:IclR family pca regulon transcriptional regulator